MKRALVRSLLMLGLIAVPAAASRDIRVVLDLSQSMRNNDPGRLAILSTILLHDLARPNTTFGDSFDVIPFDLDWRWPDPAAAPPVSTQPRIQARLGQRDDFVRALQALPYDARMTYFYPGILTALDDLERRPAGVHDVRAIVLVTDGVPESATRDAELQRIRDEIAPRLEQRGIRLYVLAFGGEADRNRDFFASMVRTPRGATLGEFFVDPNGAQLLAYMLQIFSRSFGYSPDAARPLPGTSTLDLDGRTTPEKVAVAVFASRAQPPRLRLVPPPNGSVNAPEGVQSASVPGGSYSLTWVLGPNQGDYTLDSDASPGTVAVLRPTRLTLEIQPVPPHKQVGRTLAATPFPLRILVRPATGAPGDPGPVDLSFRVFGERSRQPGRPTSSYAWESDRSGATGVGTPTAQGRTYDIVAEFREDPERPDLVYVGHLEVEVRRGEAVVGSLDGQRAHSIEVHPLLKMSPLPLSAYVSSEALERREERCATLTFHVDAGRLPHSQRPSYSIRAVLAAADPAVLSRELRQAAFTLDGVALEFEGRPGPQPGAWYRGRLLSSTELLGEHKICVRIGKPSAGDLSRPLELQMVTTLVEDPYDEFGVIRPFNLKILVAPPTLFEKWRVLVIAGLIALAIVALLWYFRDRPAFPGDLGYAIGREDSSAGLTSRPLEEQGMAATLLALTAESNVLAPGEDRSLGRVRPVNDELYQFRPARGVVVEPVGRDEMIKTRRRLATLSVHRTYRLRTDRSSYLFRMEYR